MTCLGIFSWSEVIFGGIKLLEMAMDIQNPMVFTSLGYEFGSTLRPVGLLMSTKSYLLGLWTRVCSYNIRTREPMSFLNLILYRAIVILFVSL